MATPSFVRCLNDFSIRNFITHEQKFPYNKNKSEISDLYEFAWYFIRSTDSFLAREISGIIFYPPDFTEPKPRSGDWGNRESYEYEHNGCFLVEISPKHKWQVNIQGYGVPINLFSKDKKHNWLELDITQLVDNDYRYDDVVLSLDDIFDDRPEDIKVKDADVGREKTFDKYLSTGEDIKDIEGILIDPPAGVKYMIAGYFELYMYY